VYWWLFRAWIESTKSYYYEIYWYGDHIAVPESELKRVHGKQYPEVLESFEWDEYGGVFLLKSDWEGE